MFKIIFLYACLLGSVYIFSTSLQSINKSFRVKEITQIINEINRDNKCKICPQP